MGQAIASRAVLAARHPATLVGIVLAAAFGVALLVHPGTWATFTALAGGDRETLREMLLGFGIFAPLASILINVAQAVVAPIPGFVVPFVNGAVFGTWWGMLITWIGGIAAASTCFWIARTFGRRLAERICNQSRFADSLNRKLERHSFVAIVLARIIPGVPFDFLSYFVGLTKVRFTPFVAATAVGSAPHALIYAFMGSSLHIPLWLGVLMTPALGILYAGGKLGVSGMRRGSRDDAVAEVGAPAPAIGFPALSQGPVRVRTIAGWTAPAFAGCTDRRTLSLPAWVVRERRSPVRPAAD